MNRPLFNKSLLLLLLLCFGLRFAAITFESFWLDESYTTMFDAFGHPLPNLMTYRGEPYLFRFYKPQSLPVVMANFREVDPLSPPVYPIFVNQWMVLFGPSDLAIRSLSAVISTGGVLALYMLSSHLFGPAVGLLTALIETISPYDVAYGQEARMYSLVALFSILSWGSLLRLLSIDYKAKDLKIHLPVYVFSTWAMVNSHYTALFVLAAQTLLGVFLAWRRRDAKMFGWLMIAWALVAIVWLPWFEMFLKAAEASKGSFYIERANSWWWPLSALFRRIPVNWLSFVCGKRVPIYALPLYVTATIFLVLGSLVASKSGREIIKRLIPSFSISEDSGSERFNALIVLYWSLAPALLLLVADTIGGRRVVEVSRYTIATAPALCMIAGRALAALAPYKKIALGLLATHAVFCFVTLTYMHVSFQQRPWREMAATVSKEIKPDEIVMVSEYYDIICLDHYLDHELRQVGLSPNMGHEKIQSLFDSAFPSLKKFWLISSGSGEEVMPMLPTEYKAVSEKTFPHNLHLRLFQRN